MNAFAHNAFAASGGISQTAADARYVLKAAGSFTGLTGAGFRDTSAAFDVTQTFTSSTALDAGRSITWDVKNASHQLKFTAASIVTFPAGTNTLLGSAVANTITTNGAASTPALHGSGTIFTGGTATTTKPYWLIEPTGTTSNNWSTSGTLFGGNAPSGFVGNLLDLQVNGGAMCSVSYQGTITVPNGQGLTSAGGSLTIGPNQFSDGAYVTFTGFAPTSARYTYYDSHAYLSGGYSIRFANNRNDAPDSGFVWGASGTVKVTNGSTGRGTLDAAGYQVGGVAGAAGGTFTVITSITVSNGIITAIAGS